MLSQDNIIRIAGTSTSTIDGIGLSYNIFFQGCSHYCPGCQNPDLQDFQEGYEATINDIIDHINQNLDFYDSVVLTGGDPVDQPKALYSTLTKINIPTILYTGYLFEDIPDHIRKLCSIIVDGPYISNLSSHGSPSSSNQKIYFNKNNLTKYQMFSFMVSHKTEQYYNF